MPTTLEQSHLTPIILIFVLFIASSCGSDGPFQPVAEEEEERIKEALDDRSFRQFAPSKDASPRKGVILDFFDGIRIWAQYSKNGHAVNEWEIAAQDYRLLKIGNDLRIGRGGHDPEFMIYFDNPRSTQQFPTKCENCIEVSEFSISIRDLLDSNKISFKLNNPNSKLPLPFPVFESWTRFEEDEYFD